MNQSLDYAAFGASMMAILSTVIGLAVWMAKRSENRSAEVTDRFIRHLEEASLRQEAQRAEFLESIRELATQVAKSSESQRSVAETLGEVVIQVKELAGEVAHLKSRID